jgi:transposase
MEIITGVERRRRWRAEEKLRIVAETEEPGACFAAVAKRHDVSRGLLWNWRSQVRRGALGPYPPPAFLPVRVMGEPMLAPPAVGDPARAAKRHDPDCRIEVTLTNGATVRIGQDVSLAMLRRVLTALRG